MDENKKRMNSYSFQMHLEPRLHRPKTMLQVVLATFIVFIIICGIEGFHSGVNPSKSYARINDTFEIACFTHRADGKLNFYDDDELVSESFVKRINDTYIIYRNACSKPTVKNITCKRNRDNVGYSEVFVDGEIDSVNNFKCRTRNFENLTCTFKKPESKIPDNLYRLSYIKNDTKKKHKCHLQIDWNGGFECRINISKESIKSFINFTLHASNKLYKKKEEFQVQIISTLEPRKIEQLFVRVSEPQINLPSNASVVFELPRELENASRDLLFDVRLKAEDENETEWKSFRFAEFNEDNSTKTLPLKDLKYANTIYQFKVRIKSKNSDEIDDLMWSPFTEKTFKTKPKLPEMTAKVCKNCFNVMDNGNIYLYWMEIPKFYQNGDNFSYFVRIIDQDEKIMFEAFQQKTFLMIPNDLNATALKIHIYSYNDQGLSKHYSTANVPIKENENLLNIRKELIAEFGYKLSWKLEKNTDNITNYTVLWCRQRNELPNQCDSPIKYRQLSIQDSEFTLNTSHTYQFGIAANKNDEKAATGFQWAKCTSSKPDEIGTVRSMWSEYANENSILFKWKLNCADKDIVHGYNISYCTIADDDKNICLESPKHDVIYTNDDKRNVYHITSLKPYKRYNISVALISSSKRLGAFSKPIIIRTMEASPTAPTKLEVLAINKDSIKLLWHRPKEINGPSLTYQLWYNNKMIHIDNNQTMNDSYQYTLNNLRPFTNYTITVLACTRFCSESSESLLLRTKVGKPGLMTTYGLRTFDNGTINLYWHKPSDLNGHLDFFLLKVSTSEQDYSDYSLYKISGHRNNCIIDTLTCDKSNVYFSMRGVNVDDDNSVLKGNLPSNDSVNCFASMETHHSRNEYVYGDISPPFSYMCQLNYATMISIIMRSSEAMIITASFLICLIALFIYIMIRVYKRIQEMKDIHTVWPEGFDPSDTSSEKAEIQNDLKHLDLVMSHTANNESFILTYNLSNIKEESIKDLELYENTFKAKDENRNLINFERDFLKLNVTKSKTCEVIFNGSIDNNNNNNNNNRKSVSVPNSPHEHKTNQDPNFDYMKMYQPPSSDGSINRIAPSGYMDMSGKSSFSPSRSNQSSEIKSFIRDSQLNNGYIQRKSILNMKKPFPNIINSNGYVGLRNLKN